MEISDFRIVRPSSRSAAARTKSRQIHNPRSNLRLEFQGNILGLWRMPEQRLSCDLPKSVIPSRPYEDARMRSVILGAEVKLLSSYRPFHQVKPIPLHQNMFPWAIRNCRSADLNYPKIQGFFAISKALSAPAEAARCRIKVMWRQFLKIDCVGLFWG